MQTLTTTAIAAGQVLTLTSGVVNHQPKAASPASAACARGYDVGGQLAAGLGGAVYGAPCRWWPW